MEQPPQDEDTWPPSKIIGSVHHSRNSVDDDGEEEAESNWKIIKHKKKNVESQNSRVVTTAHNNAKNESSSLGASNLFIRNQYRFYDSDGEFNILSLIVKDQACFMVNGNTLLKLMQANHVSPNGTTQPMKDRFC